MAYRPIYRPPSLAKVQRIFYGELKAAANDIARYVRNRAAKYPPKVGSASYKRTGTLGRNIGTEKARRVRGGVRADVGVNLATVPYARYVEEGTGIYGPRGQLIRPVRAKALAWRRTGSGSLLIASALSMRGGRLAPSPQHDTYMVFRAYVRGMKPWHYMRKAFTARESHNYARARAQQAVKRIERRLNQTRGG